ncbi:HAMP domain-containing sensor histidine kinase [Bacillus gobiensis]|uniref:sensor histidine kinase n=1 Tax=Bacillus gobiensis TaxID=1441095 RepID=UPI003D24B1DA
MTSMSYWLLSVLVIALIFFICRERKYRKRIQETHSILEEIVAGNENRRIHVDEKELIAPLVFQINQLVDSYQTDKVKAYRSEQARKRMLSSLSHDVRTPLTSVLGYLDALEGGLAGEEAGEYMHIARNKAYALKEYLDELFVIAQIDADEWKPSSESFDLFELLRSALIGWMPEFQKKDIMVDVQIPDSECFIIGDPHAISRVFNNLLQNALRYGGDTYVGFNAWDDEHSIHFEVWDKGPGLSPGQLSKVFDRLYKADSSRSSKGHGLGLAIAKELVQKMNGTIVMESDPFRKTAVLVSLPKVRKSKN